MGAAPSGASAGPEKVTHSGPLYALSVLPASSTAVMVTLKEVPTVGAQVAGTTEKEPAPAPAAVVEEATVVVVVPEPDVVGVDGTEVVTGKVVVVVDPVVVVVVAAPGTATMSRAEAPNMPEELSVTSSTVVPGSTRVTFTVATPAVKLTPLAVVQSPGAG